MAEKLPKGFVVGIVVGAVVLFGAGIAVPRGAAASYEHQKPKVDVARIGVESQVSHTEGGRAGMEGTIAHAEAHLSVERGVFSTPGGRYTAEDIAKNGPLAPAQKFEGITSVHDMRPSKGTLICPITMTKANPKFAWWVGGKRYTFCCPPCIEEWVMKAKRANAPLPPPKSFVAR